MKFLSGLISLLFFIGLFACGKKDETSQDKEFSFPKDSPQDLQFEVLSRIMQDMEQFQRAVKALDQKALHRIDERYMGVTFRLEQAPLFLNVYGDPEGGKIVFLVFPKDPKTGANYLLTFPGNLPVVNEPTVELQIRTLDPEKPLQCSIAVADPGTYLSEYGKHRFAVTYTLTKKFLQSGTYDFDALTVPSYRTRGYPFIVFDLAKAELSDLDAGLTGTCR